MTSPSSTLGSATTAWVEVSSVSARFVGRDALSDSGESEV
jgi:hypothetical protein